MKLLITLIAVVISANAAFAQSATRTPVYELEWSPTPFGPHLSVVSRDADSDAHITYLKFAPGMVAPLHTHTGDYVGIVLSGASKHWLPNVPESEVILSAGSHWSMPGGVEHVSECLPGVECIFILYQEQALDLLLVD